MNTLLNILGWVLLVGFGLFFCSLLGFVGERKMYSIKTITQSALRGNFRPLRRKLFDYATNYKMDLRLAIEGQGMRTSELGVCSVVVIPLPKTIHYFVKLQRPGFIIGRKGATLDAITADLERWAKGKKVKFHLTDFDPFWD